jgi:hypothetical protein
MTTKSITLKNVQDIVELVVRSPYRATQRWQVSSTSSWEYVDPEAGKAWDAEWQAFESSYRETYGIWYNTWDSNVPQEAHDKAKKISDRRPKQVNVDDWALREAGQSYRSGYIYLSRELGPMIDAIWTKREAYRGASWKKNVGTMTLMGILKRLGADAGVAEQIKAKQDAEKARAEKNTRNYHRREIKKAIKTLLEEIEKSSNEKGNPVYLPGSFIMLPKDLKDLDAALIEEE